MQRDIEASYGCQPDIVLRVYEGTKSPKGGHSDCIHIPRLVNFFFFRCSIYIKGGSGRYRLGFSKRSWRAEDCLQVEKKRYGDV